MLRPRSSISACLRGCISQRHSLQVRGASQASELSGSRFQSRHCSGTHTKLGAATTTSSASNLAIGLVGHCAKHHHREFAFPIHLPVKSMHDLPDSLLSCSTSHPMLDSLGVCTFGVHPRFECLCSSSNKTLKLNFPSFDEDNPKL